MAGDRLLIRPLTNTEASTIRKAVQIGRSVAWGSAPTEALAPEEVAAVDRVLRALRDGMVV